MFFYLCRVDKHGGNSIECSIRNDPKNDGVNRRISPRVTEVLWVWKRRARCHWEKWQCAPAPYFGDRPKLPWCGTSTGRTLGNGFTYCLGVLAIATQKNCPNAFQAADLVAKERQAFLFYPGRPMCFPGDFYCWLFYFIVVCFKWNWSNNHEIQQLGGLSHGATDSGYFSSDLPFLWARARRSSLREYIDCSRALYIGGRRCWRGTLWRFWPRSRLVLFLGGFETHPQSGSLGFYFCDIMFLGSRK